MTTHSFNTGTARLRSRWISLAFAALFGATSLAASAASADASAQLDYRLSFSDAASYVDVNSDRTFTQLDAFWSNSDYYRYLYGSNTPGLTPADISKEDSGSTVAMHAALSTDSGSLSERLHVDGADASTDTSGTCLSAVACLEAYAAVLMTVQLAPGSSMTVDARFRGTGSYVADAGEQGTTAAGAYFTVVLPSGDFDNSGYGWLSSNPPRLFSTYEPFDFDTNVSRTYSNESGRFQSFEVFFSTYSFAFAQNAPVSAVPEPGTWALFVAGLAVVGCQARRRRGLAVAVG